MANDQQQEILIRWIDEYRPLIYKVARSYSENYHDQQDLFQEIVAQLWRSIPRYQGRAKESSYLYQVALFAAMAWSRKERKRSEALVPESLLEKGLSAAEEASDPRLEWLYERIRELDEVDRSLVLLMLDGFNYREIAEVLGLSESNVGVKLTRVRKKMTKLLKEE